MKDETLLPRLTSGLSIDALAELEREARAHRETDMTSADLELMLRLRDKYEHALAEHIPMLQRWLVVTAAVAAFARVPLDMNFSILMLTKLTREELDELVCRAMRENYRFLREGVE